MATSHSNRLLATPSTYAKEHYLYVQEIGTLTSLIPHESYRTNLDSFLFFLVTEGAGTITYNGKTESIQAGDCVWLDCSRPYSHRSSQELPWTLMWVHFYGKEAVSFYNNYLVKKSTPIFRPGNLYPFTNTLTLLYREQSRKDTLRELTSHKYLTDIITHIFLENDSREHTIASLSVKYHKIRDFLHHHYQENITLDSLAASFYVSKFHLSREYHKIFGTTIGKDLLEIRISNAKSLLRFTDLTMEEISSQCGFHDPGYFIKVFKKEEGSTPMHYRKSW